MNILTKFHKDWMKTVTSIVFTSDLINILTKFHKDWMKTVTSTVYTNKLLTINILTKFHKDWMKIATSTFAHLGGCLQTKCGRTDGGQRPILKPHLSNQCSITRKTAPPPWRPYIYKTNYFTKFHDDWAKNETFRETNVLTKFHENWAKNVTSRVEKCPAHWRPCFSPIWSIFELVRDINKTNVLSHFHDDWAKIVTLSVFTRKTAPPTGGHIFQRSRTTFELNQHIIKTNI
ncbi:hypothetical protein DPMN_147321 [Dreissena polymorpha]|uniref:Uncharacterized protein n=1 Tax=Dreissena polymorpha TaxID=45954 RepID=A0A9D4F9N4_DREPO|nr:hypothetical protein DPMN_147321 [Dreissena polymorpha]